MTKETDIIIETEEQMEDAMFRSLMDTDDTDMEDLWDQF